MKAFELLDDRLKLQEAVDSTRSLLITQPWEINFLGFILRNSKTLYMNKLGVSSEHIEHVDYMWTKGSLLNIMEALKKWPMLAPGMVCSFALETLWLASLSDENYSLAKAILRRLRLMVYDQSPDQATIIWESVRDFTHGEVDKFIR